MSITRLTRRQFLKAAGATTAFAATGLSFARSAYAAASDYLQKRIAAIYKQDAAMPLRKSQDNPMVKALYKEFLERPNSHFAHHLLHTHYEDRSDGVKKLKAKGVKLKV
ncbi:MAG TPA: iron hydrogenase small subunit [bacterium]|nr:iron hydrogenase small subunit [bacterium]